jgi:two-component system sensor histidine kinase HydH
MTSLSPRVARAHAFKNCLSVVRAVNHLLEQEVSEHSRERLARSHAAVERMLALLQEEIDLERASEARNPRWISTEEVLEAVRARVEDRAAIGRVELSVRACTGGVCGDDAQLVEALANLVINAIEATPAGGRVVLAAQELEDGAQVWSVGDTGGGLPGHVESGLGSACVASREGGWGIGLAFVRQVVERHRGQMHVRSIPGSGTLISMRLPAHDGERSSSPST